MAKPRFLAEDVVQARPDDDKPCASQESEEGLLAAKRAVDLDGHRAGKRQSLGSETKLRDQVKLS